MHYYVIIMLHHSSLWHVSSSLLQSPSGLIFNLLSLSCPPSVLLPHLFPDLFLILTISLALLPSSYGVFLLPLFCLPLTTASSPLSLTLSIFLLTFLTPLCSPLFPHTLLPLPSALLLQVFTAVLTSILLSQPCSFSLHPVLSCVLHSYLVHSLSSAPPLPLPSFPSYL